uniref:Retrovirus-related Pol polyprotein from transposon TNT 1-94-like beta-barrel domain-containing protein n=1 Tax=Lactuca sativa TaxID=4236 RepID=A0A9R1V8Q2_LACSA|nr:hypothetical protein LSAT_V11C600301260 [Lactuca sativa]
MLQLEHQRQHARDSLSPADVAVAATHETPNPAPNFPNRRDNPTPNRRQSQRRSSSRGPGTPNFNKRPAPTFNRRGPHNNPPRSPWANSPALPFWASSPWWTSPPPCPYPTMPGWASPWNRPHNRQPNHLSNNAQQANNNQQAHLSAVNPLESTELGATFNAMTLEANDNQWYMDTGATTHLTADAGKISTPSVTSIKSVFVGNGNRVPVLGSGHSTLPYPSKPIHLKNILYTPGIVKNLVSVRKFTRDNFVSVEFDPYGLSVKDYKSGKLLTRHNSIGDLYPINDPTIAPSLSFFVSSNSSFWHNRLGHPGHHF